MRGSQLPTQCARALRSSLQATPRRSPTANCQFLRAASRPQARPLHSSPICLKKASSSPKNKSVSEEFDAVQSQGTNFSELDVLGNTPAPSTSVDICMYDGFALNSGVTISGGDGALLVNGEAFSWRPWEVRGIKRVINQKGQIEIPKEAFGVFEVLWPRPGMFSGLDQCIEMTEGADEVQIS